MNKKDTENNRKPSKLWFLFATTLLSLFIIVQLPVSWVIQKIIPNSPYITWVSGNLWQGSANIQLPQQAQSPPMSNGSTGATSTPADMNGTVSWQWKPLKIFLGKFHADVEMILGASTLRGEVTLGKQSMAFSELSGKIDTVNISKMTGIKLPEAPIQVNKLSVDFDKEQGFNDAHGQLTWVGGQLGYPHEGQVYDVDLPTMRAEIAVVENENKGNSNQGNTNKKEKVAENSLHLHLVNTDNKTLGDFYLDNIGMLDINLTQRLLEKVPGYSGSAPQDTAVVSLRQPITSLGK